ATAAASSRSTATGLPCTEISATSSPVAVPGPGRNGAAAVSLAAREGSQNSARRPSRGRAAGSESRGASAARTLRAPFPERRTSASAERPAGVARATIVSRNASEERIPLRSLESNLHAFQEAVAFALGLELRILRERQVHEAALPRRERGQQRRPPRAADLFGRSLRELLERLLAVGAEAFRVQPRVHGAP